MKTNGVPNQVWDFGFKHLAKIMQLLPRISLKGRTKMESVTEKSQISQSTQNLSSRTWFDIS